MNAPNHQILVLNAGSSSLKYELFSLRQSGESLSRAHKNLLHSLAKGIIDPLPPEEVMLPPEEVMPSSEDAMLPTEDIMAERYKKALDLALQDLKAREILQDFAAITAIGHRVVHGGEKYSQATLITPEVEKNIEELCVIAPLHNPANLACIKACSHIISQNQQASHIKQVAIFDTAFHQTLPEHAYLYALPYELYEKYKIRRYGFHGTSHKYVSQQTIKLLENPTASRIIVCHLGNGSSITAVKNGQSVDTSMGFTPLEGVPMGTRSGDLDPALVYWLMDNLKLDIKGIEELLVKKSGLVGLSGFTSDMRELHEAADSSASDVNEDNRVNADRHTSDQHTSAQNTPDQGMSARRTSARRTIKILAYRIAKYIAAYTVSLGGLDALTFTGGMGEKAFYLRAEICEQLKHLGVELDMLKNEKSDLLISSLDSKVKIFVVPTDEQKQIAEETLAELNI